MITNDNIVQDDLRHYAISCTVSYYNYVMLYYNVS